MGLPRHKPLVHGSSPGTQLFNLLLFDEVALRHIYAIDTATGHKQGGRECADKGRNLMRIEFLSIRTIQAGGDDNGERMK